MDHGPTKVDPRIEDFSYLLKCHVVREVRRKTAAISPHLSGAPPELSEGFDTIWPVSGRKNREVFQIRPGSPVVFRMRQSFHRF